MVKTQILLKKAPLITVFNAKGGTGKTAISLNAALSFGYGVLTNDPLSIVGQVLEESRHMILTPKKRFPKIPVNWPVIFDFGGYPDSRVLEALEISRYVLIPALPYKENIQVTLDFIKEITTRKAEDRIIVIINRTSKNQFFDTRRVIARYFPAIKVFNLKKTNAFAKMVKHKKSLRELVEAFPEHARYFKVAADQFDKIFNYIITQELKNENNGL